jgi:hypothetical protein
MNNFIITKRLCEDVRRIFLGKDYEISLVFFLGDVFEIRKGWEDKCFFPSEMYERSVILVHTHPLLKKAKVPFNPPSTQDIMESFDSKNPQLLFTENHIWIFNGTKTKNIELDDIRIKIKEILIKFRNDLRILKPEEALKIFISSLKVYNISMDCFEYNCLDHHNISIKIDQQLETCVDKSNKWNFSDTVEINKLLDDTEYGKFLVNSIDQI